jgi:hypothetical protein
MLMRFGEKVPAQRGGMARAAKEQGCGLRSFAKVPPEL